LNVYSESLILKLDSKGNLEWDKTFGGNDNDYINSVQQTRDGGYVVAGYTQSKTQPQQAVGYEPIRKQSKGTGNSSEAGVFKINSEGILNWERTLGGSNYNLANSIQQTEDLGYIVAGHTNKYGNNNVLILKLDSNGELCKQ